MGEYTFERPVDPDDLDESVGECINHLYQDEYPISYGNDAASGFKRSYPKCRKHSETSTGSMGSSAKSLQTGRALPLPHDLLKGMAALAFMNGKPSAATAALWGFLGLLRGGKVLSLTKYVFTFHRDNAPLVTACKTANEDVREEKQSMCLCTAEALLIWLGRSLPVQDPGKGYLT